VEVKGKMQEARQFCGQKPEGQARKPEKTGENHDGSRIGVVFTN
jgi:hypothetical protein